MRPSLASMALLAACANVDATPPDGRVIVAVVDGMPIYAEDFKRELARVRVSQDDETVSDGALEAQRDALLRDLINRKLSLREAERKNVVVGTDEIEAAYANRRAGWLESELEAELESVQLTPADLKREIRDRLLIAKYFRDHVFSRVAVTDAEVDAYITTHPEITEVAERMRVRQIVVKTEDDAKAVLEELKRGTSFEDAAMQHSLTPEGRNGGELGLIGRASLPAVLEEAVFALKPGQRSPIIVSDYGYHLFLATDYQPAYERSADEVRSEVETTLRRLKEEQAQAAKMKELQAHAKITIHAADLAHLR